MQQLSKNHEDHVDTLLAYEYGDTMTNEYVTSRCARTLIKKVPALDVELIRSHLIVSSAEVILEEQSRRPM